MPARPNKKIIKSVKNTNPRLLDAIASELKQRGMPKDLLEALHKMDPKKRQKIIELLDDSKVVPGIDYSLKTHLTEKERQKNFMNQRDSEDQVMEQDYKKQLSQEKSRQPLKYYEDYDIEDGN